MPDITHYWSIVHPSNPPICYFKDDTGVTWRGVYAADGPRLWEKVAPPQPRIGYHPRTRKYGYSFGEWVPIEQLRKRLMQSVADSPSNDGQQSEEGAQGEG